MNERISHNNHLIGKQPKVITSHDSFQSPRYGTVSRAPARAPCAQRPESDLRKSDFIHHHDHPKGVVYRGLCLKPSAVAVSKVPSRRWWCIKSFPRSGNFTMVISTGFSLWTFIGIFQRNFTVVISGV